LSTDYLVAELTADAQAAYDRREEQVGEEVMRELERRVILSVLDRKWREHLYEMDYLRDGIGLRAMAQRDPLIEYQREGYELFNAMMDAIKEETVGFLFNVEVQVAPQEGEAVEAKDSLVDATSSSAGASIAAAVRAPAPAAPSANGPAITAKGLGPSRPTELEYSAPTAEGGVMHETESVNGGAVDPDEAVAALGPDASRAERRRAARAARKKN
jgi:preprotein translocase subunit SecA